MHKMQQTWRWFGPSDPVSLQDVKQTGASGVVTALHHIPHGEVWTKEEIIKRKNEIEAIGLKWSVIESITVHEDIKTRSGNYRGYIEKYKTSIRNAAQCGIRIVTYNFMPVNDWTRTSLNYKMPDGALALNFDWTDLAIFDIYILKRRDGYKSYSSSKIAAAEARFKTYSPGQLDQLAAVVMFGIPGEQKATVHDFLGKLELYKHINPEALMSNLCEFQQEIATAAEECGVQLAIHPDDPPFPIFGLPRIVSREQDFQYFLQKVNIPSNGVCFCTGSLGASADNDLPAMIRSFGERIHFIHLRNVRKDAEGNFHEAAHLDGDTDMYQVVKEIFELQQVQNRSIPFRPDHGHQMLDDLRKTTNPGYSAIGRLKGLAEIRGLELGIAGSFGENKFHHPL